MISNSFKLTEVKTQLKEIITYDSLTKLLSRRAFLEQADRLYADPVDSNKAFSVLAVDLDHFKKMNDEFGHGAEDYVLYKFGEIVKNLNMGENICGRLGGRNSHSFLRTLRKNKPLNLQRI